jgi:hypothetical protein
LFGFSGNVKGGGTGLFYEPVHFTKWDMAACLGEQEVDYTFAVVRDPMDRLMSEFRYQSGVSRASRMGFSSWAHLMIEVARKEPRTHANHLRPQVDFVPEGTEVFRYEDGFDPLIDKLDAFLGEPGPAERVPFFNVRPNVPITVTRQVAELIEGFYGADYERFGYPHPTGEASDGMAFTHRAKAKILAPALIAWQRRKWTRYAA